MTGYLFLTFLLVLCASASFSQSVGWDLKNINKIGGHKTTVFGEPKVIKTEHGKAIEFDGVDNGIFIETNPLAGAKALTIEAWFRTARQRAGGAALAASGRS